MLTRTIPMIRFDVHNAVHINAFNLASPSPFGEPVPAFSKPVLLDHWPDARGFVLPSGFPIKSPAGSASFRIFWITFAFSRVTHAWLKDADVTICAAPLWARNAYFACTWEPASTCGRHLGRFGRWFFWAAR
jgi:hypothetical protein